MSTVKIKKSRLSGRVRIPASKSAAHRAIFCASLAEGVSRLAGLGGLSQDIRATLRAAEELGAEVRAAEDCINIDGVCSVPTVAFFDCGESGSTLRFLIPIAAALGIEAGFTGHGRLPERPLGAYRQLLPAHGVAYECENGKLPLDIRGQLSPGLFELEGNISSQYVTGLLMALPLLERESEIRLLSPLQSAGYVEMTIRMLRDFGVSVLPAGNGWRVPGRQRYRAHSLRVEGDWSQAAFFLCAGALGHSVSVEGLHAETAQGDRQILSLLGRFGAPPKEESKLVSCPPSPLRGIEIDASQIPDLVPILAMTAAFAEGETRITGAERLRIKESDRLRACAEGLSRMGADVTELPDGLIIRGGQTLHGAKIRGYNDHRIVMAFSIAGTVTGNMTITDADSIQKSYPGFFTDLEKLGGDFHVV